MAIKINDKNKVFLTKIQVLYFVEKSLEKFIPKIQQEVSDTELKEGLESHLKETQEHAVRLEKVFEILDSPVKKLTSEGLQGIIEDAQWVIKTDSPPDIKDLMLAGAARYLEHYEMAGYMTAIVEAEHLGFVDISVMLDETFKEEKMADEKLAKFIIKSFV